MVLIDAYKTILKGVETGHSRIKTGQKHILSSLLHSIIAEFPRAMYRKYRNTAFSKVFEFVNYFFKLKILAIILFEPKGYGSLNVHKICI
jgi:hypothetical protein